MEINETLSSTGIPNIKLKLVIYFATAFLGDIAFLLYLLKSNNLTFGLFASGFLSIKGILIASFSYSLRNTHFKDNKYRMYAFILNPGLVFLFVGLGFGTSNFSNLVYMSLLSAIALAITLVGGFILLIVSLTKKSKS